MSDGNVPPAKQCDLPSCARAAIDPTRSPAACARHAPGDDQEDDVGDREDGKTVTGADETVGDSHSDDLDIECETRDSAGAGDGGVSARGTNQRDNVCNLSTWDGASVAVVEGDL